MPYRKAVNGISDAQYGETYNAKGESCSDLSSDDRIALAAGLSFGELNVAWLFQVLSLRKTARPPYLS